MTHFTTCRPYPLLVRPGTPGSRGIGRWDPKRTDGTRSGPMGPEADRWDPKRTDGTRSGPMGPEADRWDPKRTDGTRSGPMGPEADRGVYTQVQVDADQPPPGGPVSVSWPPSRGVG